MCYSIDTTHGHACDRQWISQLFCGRWLRSGVATLPRRPWQRRSFDERSYCYFGSMAMVWGAYLWDKNTCARTSTENVEGAYARRGVYMRDATVPEILLRIRCNKPVKVPLTLMHYGKYCTWAWSWGKYSTQLRLVLYQPLDHALVQYFP